MEILYETPRRLRGQRLTWLLAEQAGELTLKVAGHADVLPTGRIVPQGSPTKPARDAAARRIHLGLETGATK